MELSQLKTNDHRTWSCFCLSVLFFPFFPALGALGILIVLGIVGRNNYQQIIRSPLNRSLVILAILLIVSAALAEYPQSAWLGLANFLPYFFLFVVLRCLITEPRQLRQLSWLLILPSFPIVLMGLGQIYAAWDTPPLIEAILGWQLVPLGEPAGRMSAVFIYANFLAIYLAIAFTLTLGLGLAIWQQQSYKSKNLTLCLLTLILLADLSGLILTSSRNAWGLAVFSCLAYALYLGWKWLVWGFTGAATAILWASFAPHLGGTQLRQVIPAFIWLRLSDQAYDRPVETLRLTQWQFCWDLIKERPFLGWGLRNFTPLYQAKTNLWLGHPHNLFLMFGAETGIISLLLFSAIIATIMFQGIKSWLNNGHPQAYAERYPLGPSFYKSASPGVSPGVYDGRGGLRVTSVEQISSPIFFSYLLAFTNCVLFNLTDVTIFDLRVNTIIWILLAAISGVKLERDRI